MGHQFTYVTAMGTEAMVLWVSVYNTLFQIYCFVYILIEFVGFNHFSINHSIRLQDAGY